MKHLLTQTNYQRLIEKAVIFDIEVGRNLFIIALRKYSTGKEIVFEISKRKNQAAEIVDAFRNKLPIIVGFNSHNFDIQVIARLSQIFNRPVEVVLELLHSFSSDIIAMQKGEYMKENKRVMFSPYYFGNIHIDLFKTMHYDNPAKHTSLKWIQFSTGFDNVEDTPEEIYYAEDYSEEDIENIISYCKNDVRATSELFSCVIGKTEHPVYKGKDLLKLRYDIANRFFEGDDTVLNWSDVKIGERYIIQKYCNIMDLTIDDLWEKKKREVKKRKPRTYTYNDLFPRYDQATFSNEMLEHIYKISKIVVYPPKEESPSYSFYYKGNYYTVGLGGLHSINEPKAYRSDDKFVIKTADVSSMYPNNIRKLNIYPDWMGPTWNKIYSSMIPLKEEATIKYKNTKDPIYEAERMLYKIALNAGYGKLGDENSLFYDPISALRVTITGQFDLLLLIDMLERNGIHVICANTDGVESLCPREKEDKYYSICAAWQEIIGNKDSGVLEHKEYNMMVMLSVNHYFAVYKDGTIKRKGDFSIENELHKQSSFLVIPKAVEEYYVKGTPIRDFIYNHKILYDFLGAVKSNKSFYYVLKNDEGKVIETIKQRVIRYYVSREGNYLYKVKDLEKAENKKGASVISVQAGYKVKILNNMKSYDIEDYKDIDYSFYIEEAKKIKDKIEANNIVLELF